MKAVVVREPGPVGSARVEEISDPRPAPEEVLVDVVVAETNYPDLLVMEGRYQFKPPTPFSPGKAAVGRVAAIGADVSGWRIGAPVAVQVEYGAYAERVRAPAANCYPIPEGVDFHIAAALGLTYQTAWFALFDRARFERGESVLVLGAAGGVGVAAVQLARAFGAGTIFAGVRGESNAAVARAAGADHVVDTADPNLRDSMRERIFAATGGHGVDVVIDPVGAAPQSAALRALAWCGRLVVIGFAGGDIPAIKSNYLLVKNIEVSGLQWSDYRDRAPDRVARAQAEIFELGLSGAISPLISHRFPLERFAEALELIRLGHAQGKVLLDIAS